MPKVIIYTYIWGEDRIPHTFLGPQTKTALRYIEDFRQINLVFGGMVLLKTNLITSKVGCTNINVLMK